MATAITTFEKWFKAELPLVGGLSAAVGGRIYNGSAGSGMPFLILTVFPLQDRHGQARTSVQTRLAVDVKFVSKLPFPTAIDMVIEAMDERFRQKGIADSGGYRISIWRENPISLMENGAVPEEKILSRGSIYRATMSKIYLEG